MKQQHGRESLGHNGDQPDYKVPWVDDGSFSGVDPATDGILDVVVHGKQESGNWFMKDGQLHFKITDPQEQAFWRQLGQDESSSSAQPDQL